MKLIIFLLTFSLISFAKVELNESKWKKSVNEDGVQIYGQRIKGHDIIAFRTVYTVDAPIDQLLTVLRDAKGSVKWADDLLKVQYISEPSDLEATIYEVRKFPWPFQPRDLVIHYLLTINSKRKSISVKFNSVTHKDFPKKKGKVRASLEYGLFEFWPQKDRTKIELTILADPAGSIPSWVVNLFQKTKPFDYIKKLEKEAKKSDKPIRPGIKAAIEEYYSLFPETRS